MTCEKGRLTFRMACIGKQAIQLLAVKRLLLRNVKLLPSCCALVAGEILQPSDEPEGTEPHFCSLARHENFLREVFWMQTQKRRCVIVKQSYLDWEAGSIDCAAVIVA